MIPGVPSSRRRRAIDRARLVVEVPRSVTTPLLEGSGFSGQLRGNPPAYVSKAVSRPVCPLMHILAAALVGSERDHPREKQVGARPPDRRRIGKLRRQGYAYETSGSLEGYLRDVTAA